MAISETLPILSYNRTLESLPPPITRTNLAESIAKQQASESLPLLVVLDDDPTGTQTCHGINVLTVWDTDTLTAEFRGCSTGFFILTNSRALPPQEARVLIQSVCRSLKYAASVAKKEFEVVLRGDSTLRGHFPDEPEVAEQELGDADAWIMAPYFHQGGRLTIDDVHYVANTEKDELVPAAQTPFAKDATFGYESSNLRDYVLEKSKGNIHSERIFSISLEDSRNSGALGVCSKLLSFPPRSVVIVNAVVDTDMEVFVEGLLLAQEKGKKCIYRTGAAFVSTRLGIHQIPPLSAQDLGMELSPSSPGGLIIAGSHVPKSTTQLQSLVDTRGNKLTTLTLDIEALLDDPETAKQTTLPEFIRRANKTISEGTDVLFMTSRKLIVGGDELSSLKVAGVVAEALVYFLQHLESRPRYIIAKGGITSSDAATKGLGFKRAKILGQASAGVPLWQCTEPTSKFTGVPYVVFPGNVGSDSALSDLVTSWAKLGN